MPFTAVTLQEALETLGELLADRGESAELVAIGGGSLLLLNLIERPTKDLDLVAGFATRLATRQFGSLTLHLAGRFDQICFKLYASADQGPRSKHVADLKRLAPTRDELARAAAWCVTHDASEGFAQQLKQAVQFLGGADDA